MLSRLRNTTILTQTLLSLLLVGLLPLAVVTWVIFNTSQAVILNEVESKLLTAAESKIVQIESYALERTLDVTALAQIPTVVEAVVRLESVLQSEGIESNSYQDAQESVRLLLRFTLERAGYTNLMLFSESGDLLFSVLPSADIGGRYPDLYPQSALVQSLDNARTLLETEISQLAPVPGAESDQAVAFISAPVLDDGIVVGMIAIQLDNNDMYSVISDRLGLGESGVTVVVYSNGDDLIFAAPTFHAPEVALQSIYRVNREHTQPLEQAIHGIQGEGITRDYRNQQVIGVWRYLPSLRWGMLVKLDTQEAFAPLVNQRNLVLGLGILTLLVIVATSYSLANSLSRPVKNLVQATQLVAGGVYENKIAVQGTGEIAQLVDAFDLLINNTIQARTQELEHVAQQERENNRLKDEFIAVMSHELRTPLNAILGMTEGLKDEVFGEVNKKQLKSLQTIEASGFHLLSLINDILDVAKIESGKLKPDLTMVSLVDLCTSSLAFVKELAQRKNISIKATYTDAITSFSGDERLLRQVLINLLSNAVKFTPEAGVIKLSTSLVPRPDASTGKPYFRIAVEDSGIGIATKDFNKLFKPFVQIDSALNREYAGTGLGLALVKKIVDLHDGRIHLTSKLGKGSCFAIDLPFDPVPSRPERTSGVANKTSAAEAPDASSKSPLILLAEDNEASEFTISSYLVAKGFRVILAKNGSEAIAMAYASKPDLILMDIQMSVMDGLTAIRKLRQDPGLSTLPIIALTALAMESDRESCMEAGATDYFSKPVKLKELTAHILELV
jgi:signal transduction histidine kinase